MRKRRRQRDERGAIVVITALLTCMVLMLVAALTVDLGNTWARRGQLQTQADNAAIFAANYLPASTPSARLVAAKAATFYLACHPVNGQAQSDNATFPIPRTASGDFFCPSASFDPTATTYDAAAGGADDQRLHQLPQPFEIAVTTPWARVDYGFAKMAGVDKTDQRKSATAHVYSPGGIVPMGGSLGCIAAAANSTGLLGLGDTLSKLVPINYWSAGKGANALGSGSGGSGIGVTWPVTPPKPTAAGAALTTTGAVVTGSTVTVSYNNASGLTGIGAVLSLLTSNLVGLGVEVWFGRGSSVYKVPTAISAVGTTPLVPIPAAVLATPGEWHVKVMSPMATRYQLIGGFTFGNFQSTNDVTISVGASGLGDLTNLDNLLSCAKPVLSPRTPAGTESADLIANIRKGLDHALGTHPALVTAASGLTNLSTTSLGSLATGAVTDPSKFALSCAGNVDSVVDTSANSAAQPNCVKVDTNQSWNYEFTQGFLTPQGRLSCALPDNCNHATFNGSDFGMAGQYNDDQLADFINAANKTPILDDMLFTSLDTMIQTSIPLLTPNNLISSDLYASPRFFWAPVLTTVYTTGTTASYPVLTFRPAFITQESPSLTGTQKLLNSLSLELDAELAGVISGGITLLNGVLLATIRAAIGPNVGLSSLLSLLQDPSAATKVEQHGLVVDKSLAADRRLEALRVMNINPGALPAVDQDYSGPITDYLGSGPRVIRLVD